VVRPPSQVADAVDIGIYVLQKLRVRGT